MGGTTRSCLNRMMIAQARCGSLLSEECCSTPLQWLCKIVGYNHELEHDVTYVVPEHPKHPKIPACVPNIQTMQDFSDAPIRNNGSKNKNVSVFVEYNHLTPPSSSDLYECAAACKRVCMVIKLSV